MTPGAPGSVTLMLASSINSSTESSRNGTLGAGDLDHRVDDQVEKILEHDLGVQIAIDLQQLQEDLSFLLHHLDLSFLLEPGQGLEKVVGRQIDRLLGVLRGDVLKEQPGLADLDAVSRTELFPEDENAVDQRAVAALQADKTSRRRCRGSSLLPPEPSQSSAFLVGLAGRAC